MGDISIEEFKEEFKDDLANIWIPWFTDLFKMEIPEHDIIAVKNPVDSYITKGGMVFYALKDAEVVGIIALKVINEKEYEFCKLVVLHKARGFGLGKKLIQKCIDFVKQKNGTTLYLQTLNSLNTARNVYQELGFIDCEAPHDLHVHARTEIIQKLQIQ